MKKQAISVVVTFDDESTFEWRGVDAQRVSAELTKIYEKQFYANTRASYGAECAFVPPPVV